MLFYKRVTQQHITFTYTVKFQKLLPKWFQQFLKVSGKSAGFVTTIKRRHDVGHSLHLMSGVSSFVAHKVKGILRN